MELGFFELELFKEDDCFLVVFAGEDGDSLAVLVKEENLF